MNELRTRRGRSRKRRECHKFRKKGVSVSSPHFAYLDEIFFGMCTHRRGSRDSEGSGEERNDCEGLHLWNESSVERMDGLFRVGDDVGGTRRKMNVGRERTTRLDGEDNGQAW